MSNILKDKQTIETIMTYHDCARSHPTGRLWVDCLIKPTMIAHRFVRSWHDGDFLLEQQCLKEMLPYFFASGHHNYARYVTWHLREMANLPHSAKKYLLDGAHVCRHADGRAPVPSDQFGEQTYIKPGKGAGGLNGISTNTGQVAVWVNSFSICPHVSMTMDTMYCADQAKEEHNTTAAKHKEEGEKRRQLDADDRQKVLDEFTKCSHALEVSVPKLYNINNGQKASADVNVHDAVYIGDKQSQAFAESLPAGFHSPIKKMVKTMQNMKKTVLVKGKAIYDMDVIFGRLIVVGQLRGVNHSDVFQFELSPVPPSIIDEFGCLRKGDKSVLVRRLGYPLAHAPDSDVLLVDASQLLYHVVWPVSGTVSDIANSFEKRLNGYPGETYVIYDRYDETASAKDHERQRRAGVGSTEFNLNLNTPLSGRDHVMKNGDNKRQLSRLLCTFDLGRNVHMIGRADSSVTHDEADITIISYMIRAAAAAGASVIRILCDDSDVFILAVYWMWKKQVKCHVQFEKWDHTVLDVNVTVAALGAKCQDLLAIYALSGCDTVPFPCSKGKLIALKVIQNNDIAGLDTVLGREDATLDQIKKTAEEFFRALYGQKKAASLNDARCRVYKSRKKNPALKNLPPTDQNLLLHTLRAHLQMLLWKAADKDKPPAAASDITNFGWEITQGRWCGYAKHF